ncbi:MFS transporter [Paenibacillus thailandensis]|jgi:DHA1 family inner membrane transport protein|uniref:MFS transporter n=1 Tax=Paenibacillus thailandensis TaxID=393250 RepID=A0ABW5QUM4_9BACL
MKTVAITEARRNKSAFALWLLTIAVFAVGTAELLPMGLLLPIAEDTGVSVPAAGLLVTAYALGVVIGGPVLSALTGTMPRKPLLVGFLMLFILGSALCGFAVSYGMLLAGRIVSALAQGVLFGIIVVMAKDMAEPGKEGRNIAMVASGLTVAVVVGSPLGTMLGELFGWRAPFLSLAVLALALLVFIGRLPDQARSESVPLSRQLRSLTTPQFGLALLMTVFGTGGTFTVFTYIAPILERNGGFSGTMTSAILLVFGAGSVVGNLLGGWLADRRLQAALLGGMVLLAVSMPVFTWASRDEATAFAAAFVWGIAAYCLMTPLNMRVLGQAGGAQELASTLNISAFNLGNALGSFAGSAVIDAGLGLNALPWTASLITLTGIAVALWSAWLERRVKSVSRA